MNGAQKLGVVGVAVGIAIIAGVQSGSAQQSGPTESKGLSVKPLVAVDLGPQFPAMAGRELRMRIVTLEPGGVLAVHEHKDRPATDYVVQGAIVDHRGGDAKEYRAGMALYEDKDTVHWVENQGTTPAVVVSADIFKS
ncbi:MAG: cupin domain-containing protein [Betaproteobacteria bacterium]|nr:cupin domain-containing protein [Betaproteobacteria bacterium]